MAVVSDPPWREFRALSIFVFYISICALLGLTICWDLYASFKAAHSIRRKKTIGLFVFLTIASLMVTWVYMIKYFVLSYRTWCFDHANPGELSNQSFGAWLSDVQLFRDAWETATETQARLFWSHPIFFLTAAWSLFLAREGRFWQVRKLWRYMLLGQIVAISFAANLFFVAVLLAANNGSSENGNRRRASKTAGTILDMIWDALPAILTTGSVLVLPEVANTPYYMPVLALPHLILFLPLITSSNGSGKGLRNIYWAILVFAGCVQLQVYASVEQNYGTESHLHRHSRPFNTDVARNVQLRQAGAARNIIAALYDHPAVGSVGWDSLLCSISFGTWHLLNRRSVSTKIKNSTKIQ